MLWRLDVPYYTDVCSPDIPCPCNPTQVKLPTTTGLENHMSLNIYEVADFGLGPLSSLMLGFIPSSAGVDHVVRRLGWCWLVCPTLGLL